MSTFFTSDCHFFHRNIIGFCNRPYKNVEEMNEQLIINWNDTVTNKDDIYCLGDFGWQLSPEMLNIVLSRLNGRKHLIVGNHDKFNLHNKSHLWESVDYYKHINVNKKRLILCHYPIFDFDGAYHKSIHLFGHIHNQCDLDEIYKLHRDKCFYSYCVGVDFNNYKPIEIDEILNKIEYCV